MGVGDAVERERSESGGGGGGEDQMETEREERAVCAKQGNNVRSYLQRAEWRPTQIDGPRH